MTKKIIVADAGPLIAFAKIDHLSLLSAMFGKIIIPDMVARECLADMTKSGAIKIKSEIEHKKIQVDSTVHLGDNDKLFDILDRGEASALLLAESLKAPILIDEKLGRRAAEKMGLKVIGTAGALIKAKEQNGIKKIAPIINDLKSAGYFLSHELIKLILKKVGE